MEKFVYEGPGHYQTKNNDVVFVGYMSGTGSPQYDYLVGHSHKNSAVYAWDANTGNCTASSAINNRENFNLLKKVK